MSQEKRKINISVITPLSLEGSCEEYFYSLSYSGRYKYISFLDSSLTPNKYSRFSYLAFIPDFAIKASKKSNQIIFCGHQAAGGTVLTLQDFMEQFKIIKDLSDREIILKNSGKYLQAEDENKKNICLNNCGSQEVKKLFFNASPVIFLKSVFKQCSEEETIKLYFQDGNPGPVDSSFKNGTIPDFLGGFAGYFSYDLKDYFEKLPDKAIDDQDIPLFYFLYFSRLLAFSHETRQWFMLNNYKFIYKNEEEKNNFFKECRDTLPHSFSAGLKDIVKKEIDSLRNTFNSINVLKNDDITNLMTEKYSSKKIKRLNLVSNFNKKDYLSAVTKAKRYIHEGHIYQVNMTQRFECGPDIDPYDLYFILRRKNPAPFSAYLSFPEFTVGSSSPERFLFLKDNIIQTRPIKGTRPRGKNTKEDNFYINELKNSLKDRAELNMIVDLERNDLGKFCKYGTVKVKEHAIVEKYAKVFHLVSTVKGRVQDGYDIMDIIKATFPGGSITGAPKIRAMEIIDELEPLKRGVYTGAIGYIGDDMTMDLNIVIRTFIIKDGKFYYNAGGGIVEDSIAEAEYQETLDKGLALKETLEFFTDGKS